MASTFVRPEGAGATEVDEMNLQFATRLDTDHVTVLAPTGSFDFQLKNGDHEEVARITGTNIMDYCTPTQQTTLRTVFGELRDKVVAECCSTYATSVLTGGEDIAGILPIDLLIGDVLYECRPPELPTDTYGYVFSDGTIAGVIAALAKAINLTGIAGTDYAASMAQNAWVEVTAHDATTLSLRAREPGADGNNIPTKSIDYPSWTFSSGAHMSGGAG